jgi:hypothetical protein
VMVEAAHLQDFDHPSRDGPLRPPGLGRIFVERQMGAPRMVISAIRSQRAAQGLFTEDDDVVQTLAANRADQPFDVGSLPGRARGGEHLFDAHGLDLLHEVLPEDPIPIPQQVTRSTVPRKRLPELVRGPFRGRVGP